jgi:hypothetical protein
MPTPAGRSDTSQGLQSQPENHGFELSQLEEWLPPLLSVIRNGRSYRVLHAW